MNTRSRGAAITRHNTISRSGAHVVRESWDATGVTFRFIWLRGFDACEEAFETIEARLPRLSGVFEPTGGFRQTLDTQVARAPLAFASAGDKPGALQDLQVLRYGRQAHGEGLCDFLDRHVAVGRQLAHNRKPSRIAERREGLGKFLRNKHVFLSKII
jgi:hypothetical protein